MGYPSLRACVEDLERHGALRRVELEVDPRLELAEIHRRVHASAGPALLFTRVKGTRLPVVSNLFGTLERARWIFRDALHSVQTLVDAKAHLPELLQNPARLLKLPGAALSLPVLPVRTGPVMKTRTTLGALPQVVCWPEDGGPFVMLPQVYTEHPAHPGWRASNLGMYRIQLGGNDYLPDQEAGLHYQLHRGIGVHQTAARERGERLPVSVFVGGPPSMTVAAVMPLPEGLPELAFAGALNRRNVRMHWPREGSAIHVDADVCIRGYVNPTETKPEGPFGDHLGYYSQRHDFPVLHVEEVLCREDAIWPITVVGRPPQEDTTFGQLIHELTAPLVPTVLPGVHAIHAVDAAGVHPLLLALGSERYTPYAPTRRPMELLTQASAILGNGQMSLAKYLFIAAKEDAPSLDVHHVEAFLQHILERMDPTRDLHFTVHTTIDTLDYTGDALNQGSKLVVAAVGPSRRVLAKQLPTRLPSLDGFGVARLCLPGVLAWEGPRFVAGNHDTRRLCEALQETPGLDGVPLILLVDDASFTARALSNLLWILFTRSNPAVDIDGVGAFFRDKGWGCEGPLVIDARIKPHHSPPVLEDPEISRRVDTLFARRGPLAHLG